MASLPGGEMTSYPEDRATFNHAPNEPARLLFALTKLIAGSYALYVH